MEIAGLGRQQLPLPLQFQLPLPEHARLDEQLLPLHPLLQLGRLRLLEPLLPPVELVFQLPLGLDRDGLVLLGALAPPLLPEVPLVLDVPQGPPLLLQLLLPLRLLLQAEFLQARVVQSFSLLLVHLLLGFPLLLRLPSQGDLHLLMASSPQFLLDEPILHLPAAGRLPRLGRRRGAGRQPAAPGGRHGHHGLLGVELPAGGLSLENIMLLPLMRPELRLELALLDFQEALLLCFLQLPLLRILYGSELLVPIVAHQLLLLHAGLPEPVLDLLRLTNAPLPEAFPHVLHRILRRHEAPGAPPQLRVIQGLRPDGRAAGEHPRRGHLAQAGS
mmetsp:Transcript_56210/g.147808  ORF Transcript_56210/g.147808 Transcript_56210/m.147808 type:complete len:331 (+) Transcript_56210:435-1427(+)